MERPTGVTVLGVLFAQLLGGTVIVETVFVLPGLGGLASASVSAHDLPVVEGVASQQQLYTPSRPVREKQSARL